MAQLIYAISALGIVVVVAVSMQRSSSDSEQGVYTNEVLTQLVAVGRDVVDDIGRQNLPFDAKVDPDRLPSSATYPFVHGEGELTGTSDTDWGACADTAWNTCQDIDDFDGHVVEGTKNGLDYEAEISVKYVKLDDPNKPATDFGGKSYAKEVTVTVTSQSVQIAGNPISTSYSRVLTYPRITNYAY